MGKFDNFFRPKSSDPVNPPSGPILRTVRVTVIDDLGPVPNVLVRFIDNHGEGLTNSLGTAAIRVNRDVRDTYLDIISTTHEPFNAHVVLEFGDDHLTFQLTRLTEARKGIVAIDGSSFADDGGKYLARGASLFWFLWGYKNDRARLKDNLQFLKEHKVDYIRALGAVGPEHWSDRVIDPTEANYGSTLVKATEWLYNDLGMRVQWTIFGGVDFTPTPAARREVIFTFSNFLTECRQAIQLIEVGNELFQNGIPNPIEVREYAMILRNNLMVPVGLSAVPEGENEEESHQILKAWYDGSRADVFISHEDRSSNGTGKEWRYVRQTWEEQFKPHIPRAWVNNEPKGPQSSVEADDDPLRITMHMVNTFLCGGAGYVLHTGAGIRGGGKEDLDRGRSKNIWEVPNIDLILGGMGTAIKLLPADIPNWRRHNTNSGFPDYPFQLRPGIQDLVEREAILRAFCAEKDGRFIVAPLRIQEDCTLKARRKMNLTVLHPLTGEVLNQHSLESSGEFVLKSDPPAQIIDGQYL